MTLDDVRFETGWETEADATLAIDGPGGRRLTLHADLGAQTSRGRLAVTHRRAWTSRSPSASTSVGARRSGGAAAAAAAPDLGQRARGGPVAHPRRRRLPRLAARRSPACSITTASGRAGQRPHGHSIRVPPDPGRGHPTLAHGIRRDRGERRPRPQRAGPGGGDHARQPLGAAPGARRRRPGCRRAGAGVVAAADLRRRVRGVSGYTVTHTGGSSARRGARHPRARSPG